MQFLHLFIAVYSVIPNHGCSGEPQDMSTHPGHLKRYASQGPFVLIDEIERFPSASEFFRDYVAPNSPVVMRGVLKDTKPFQDWTDEYFLNLTIPADDRVKLQGPRGVLDLPRIHFQDFVRTYNQSNEYMETDVPAYLGREVQLAPPLNCPEVYPLFDYTNLWYSKGGTKSPVHTDGNDNLLCMYAGEKEITLIDPDQYLSKDGIDPVSVAISYMDVERVDYTKHPDLAKVEFWHKTNLSGGDCLYIPYNWIHQVFSHNRNIAINIWWNHPKDVTQVVEKCDNISHPPITIDQKLRARNPLGYLPATQINYFLDDLTRNLPADVEDLKTSFLDLLIVGQYYVKIFREPGEGANKINVGKYSEEDMERKRSLPDVKAHYINQVIPVLESLDQNQDGLITREEMYSQTVQKSVMPKLYQQARSLEKILMVYTMKWAKQKNGHKPHPTPTQPHSEL